MRKKKRYKGICVYCKKERSLCGKGTYCITCYRKIIRKKEECKRCKKIRSLIKGFCHSCYTFQGGYTLNRRWGMSEKHKKDLMKNKKFRCLVCPERRKGILEMHHLDNNKKNNKEENLIYLCANHHRALHYGYLKLK